MMETADGDVVLIGGGGERGSTENRERKYGGERKSKWKYKPMCSVRYGKASSMVFKNTAGPTVHKTQQKPNEMPLQTIPLHFNAPLSLCPL